MSDRIVTLVRHAAPSIDPGVPASEWSLSPAGVDDSIALAEDLRTLRPASLVSSTEPKAVQTARLIAQRLQLKLSTRDGLREHRRSGEFLSRENFDSNIRAFFRHPAKLVYGHESCEEVGLRIETEVHLALSCDPSHNVILVTHGTVMASFIRRHWSVNAHEVWMSLGLPAYLAFTVPTFGIVGASGVDESLFTRTHPGA